MGGCVKECLLNNLDYDTIYEVVSQSKTWHECCLKLGYEQSGKRTRTRVQKKCDELGISYIHLKHRIGKTYLSSDDEFAHIVKEAKNFCNCADLLGLSHNGGNARTQIKKRCEELNIDYSHFYVYDKERNRITSGKHSGGSTIVLSDEELFSEDSNHGGSVLKGRIIKENLIPYKCAICGNVGEWNGKLLVLQLDHISGVRTDNRLENLRFLCPNCHSQTDTFSGKKKQKK